MNGFLVIDKAGGMTSRDCVNLAQRWFPRGTKIGHTGTLDPLATGALVLCIGTATKLADRVQAMPKQYETRIRLGATSTTDDAEGDVIENPATVIPTRGEVEAALTAFVGSVEQLPPQFSALKVQGRRAYDLARRGIGVALQPRIVRIDSVALLHYDWPWVDLRIDCGKGTYIRSIARDLGASLGVGGLVQKLRRTIVGPFTAERGITVDATAPEAVAAFIPTTAVASSGEMIA